MLVLKQMYGFTALEMENSPIRRLQVICLHVSWCSLFVFFTIKLPPVFVYDDI